jgi:hypothetical protein
MKKTRVVLAAIALFAGGVLAACGEDDEDFTDEELRTRLVEVLTEDGGPLADDQATAECAIDHLFDNLERDDINQLANAQNSEDASEEQIGVLTDGLIDCTLGG